MPLRTSQCSALQPNTAGFSVAALAFSSSEVSEGGWRLTALSDQPLKGWSEQMSSRIESFDGEQILPITADLLTSQALHTTSDYVRQTHRMSPSATLYGLALRCMLLPALDDCFAGHLVIPLTSCCVVLAALHHVAVGGAGKYSANRYLSLARYIITAAQRVQLAMHAETVTG